jgi:glycosyltransferase involved in cell wall biosynthesis
MIHLVGLPHTEFDDFAYSSCAFTAKAVRWSRVLRAIGRDVTVYWGGDGTKEDVPFVSILGRGPQLGMFGEWDPKRYPNVNWDGFQPHWQTFNLSAIKAVQTRIKPGDVVALTSGAAQNDVGLIFRAQGYPIIEAGIGYEGIATGTFCCFESYAWMHYVYGLHHISDGRFFDTVIPNFLDTSQFDVAYSDDRVRENPYLLFLGRMIDRKGIQIAAEVARDSGMHLKMAGAGVNDAITEPGRIVTDDGTVLEGDIEYVGAMNPTQRRELIADSTAMIVPTKYIEPFGTVHAEALISGVPVITPDFGVFTETVGEHDGVRYHTHAEAVQAVHKYRDESLSDDASRFRGARAGRAVERFSMEAVEEPFDRWLEQVQSLARGGWYAPLPDKKESSR